MSRDLIERLQHCIVSEAPGSWRKETMREAADRLAALEAEASEGERWQPIETAPKDVAILIYDQGQGRCIAYWAEWHDNLLGEDREGWRTMGDWERLDWVTHWMAIPGPPLPHDSREG